MTTMTLQLGTRGIAPASPTTSVLAEVFADLAPQEAAAIIEALAVDIDAAATELDQAARDTDPSKARRAAHRLAGLLGHCGHDVTAALARHVSAAADDDALTGIPALLEHATAARMKIAELL